MINRTENLCEWHAQKNLNHRDLNDEGENTYGAEALAYPVAKDRNSLQSNQIRSSLDGIRLKPPLRKQGRFHVLKKTGTRRGSQQPKIKTRMKQYRNLLFLSYCLIPFLGLQAAKTKDTQKPPAATTIKISIDTTKPNWVISKYLTGMHAVYGSEHDKLWEDPKVAEWMKTARVGTIRYPGGTAVQTWHWEEPSGINFEEDAWAPGYDKKPRDEEDWMGLDEYIAFCRKIHADPMIGINTKSGKKYNRQKESIESAVNLVKHCKEKGYNVRLWYIGNESYIGWSAKGYAAVIDTYAKAMKSIDPNITIIGDWKFGPEDKQRFQQTIEICLRSKEIDVMEIHEKYFIADKTTGFGLMSDGYNSETIAGWQAEKGLYHGRLDHYINEFYKEMKTHNKDIKLAFNEWTAAGTGSHNAALVKADYLLTMFNHPIFSACDWSTHWKYGPLDSSRHTGKLKGFTPTAHIYEMLAHALEKNHLSMTSDGGNVYGFAAAGETTDSVQVYLLNKRSTSVTAEIEVGDAYRNASFKIESFVNPGKITISDSAKHEQQSSASITLPALSFNRIVFSKK